MENIDLKKCPFCAEDIKIEAIVCKHCWKSLNENNEKVNKIRLNNGEKVEKSKHVGPLWILITIFVFVAFFIIWNYHIVFNTSSILVARPYFGFSDIIADSNACTSGPWIIAMSNHPSLCKGLQNAWYLESDDEMNSKIADKIKDNLNNYQDCASKCNFTDTEYSKCVNNCIK